MKNLYSVFFSTVRRFPLPVICSLIFCFLSIEEGCNIEHKDFYFCSLLNGFFLFTSLKLLAESRRWSCVNYYSISIAIWGIFNWYFYKYQNFQMYFFSLGVFLLPFITPFLKNTTNDDYMWEFDWNLTYNLFFTCLFSALLLLLSVVTVTSIEYLFNFKIYQNWVKDIFCLIVISIAPLFMLTKIPYHFNEILSHKPSKILQFFLIYILVPFIGIYTGILYTYTFKMLFLQSLPKGKIGYLVSIYGCAAMFTYLFSYPFKENVILSWFKKIFPKLFLLPLILLGIAIITRIKEYGIVERRYILIIFLIWFSLSSLISIFKNNNQPPVRFIITTFSLLLILSSFGPWNIDNISKISQLNRLEEMFIKNNILKEGKIQRKKAQIDLQESDNIKSMLQYLNNRKVDKLKIWFPELFELEPKMSAQELTKAMLLSIGFNEK